MRIAQFRASRKLVVMTLGLGWITPMVSAGVEPGPATNGRAEAVLSHLDQLVLTHLEIPTEPRRFATRLDVSGETMTLRLTPHSNRAKDFRVVVHGPGGEQELIDPGPVRTLRGTIDEIPGARVAGLLTNKGLEAFIQLPDDSVVQIEPVPKFDRRVSRGEHAVFNCEELGIGQDEGDAACGVMQRKDRPRPLELASKTGTNGENCAYLGTCVAAIILDSDWKFFDQFGGTAEEVQAHMEFMLEWTNSRYESDFHITHQILQLVVRTDDATDPYRNISDGDALLAKIHQVWNNPPSHNGDLVHLFSAAVTNDLGQGHIGTVCDTGFIGMQSYAIGVQADCGRAGRMMHELGHNWGSPDLVSGLMNTFSTSCVHPWDDAVSYIVAERDLKDGLCLVLLESPQVRVQNDSVVIPNNGTFNFGTRLVGSPNNQTFLLANDGDSDLLSSNLSVPAGYSITTALPSTLPPATSGNFAVQLNATAAGTLNGNIQFDNNDPDDDPFVIQARGIVIVPGSLDPAWVDFAYTGDQYGTQTQPFKSVALAAGAVTNGGTVRLKTGSSTETVTINKAMTLVADNGPVVLGQ